MVLNYIKNLLILVSMVTASVSVSTFALFVGIPIRINISAVGSKVCVVTAGIKKYKSIIKMKRKKLDKVVLSAKDKLNTTEVLISKDLIDSFINHFIRWIICWKNLMIWKMQ